MLKSVIHYWYNSKNLQLNRHKKRIIKNIKVRKQRNLVLGLQIRLPACQTPAHQTVNILMALRTTCMNIYRLFKGTISFKLLLLFLSLNIAQRC